MTAAPRGARHDNGRGISAPARRTDAQRRRRRAGATYVIRGRWEGRWGITIVRRRFLRDLLRHGRGDEDVPGGWRSRRASPAITRPYMKAELVGHRRGHVDDVAYGYESARQKGYKTWCWRCGSPLRLAGGAGRVKLDHRTSGEAAQARNATEARRRYWRPRRSAGRNSSPSPSTTITYGRASGRRPATLTMARWSRRCGSSRERPAPCSQRDRA